MEGKWFLLFSILCLFSVVPSPTLRAQNTGFVYVGNHQNGQSDSILGYAISDNNGALTPVPGSPFPTQFGNSNIKFAVTPSGRFLYTPSAIPGNNGVNGYAIDANSGSLTPIPGSPFFAETADIGPGWLVMDPLGRFLYAVDLYYGQIFVYSIDQNTGALTQQSNSPFYIQYAYPNYFGLDATGQYAYSTSYQPFRSNAPDGAISVYKIDQATGSFALVPGSPFLVPRDPSAANKYFPPSPSWAVTDVSSRFLYVTDSAQLDLWTFAIDGVSGALTLSPSSPVHMPHGSNQFMIDPTGSFAYFTTLYPNSTDCANYFPYSNVYAPDSVFVYSIDQASGALSPSSSPMVAAGYQPFPLATDPSGRFIYILNLQGYNFDPNSSTISAYRSRGIGGPVTEVLGSPFAAGAKASPFSLVVAALQKKN
jgi:6-phosphogluconolactonase (cycloisomerase 2 family)